MKKRYLLLIGLALVFSMVLAGCGSSGSSVEIQYGESELYSQEDMESAVQLIQDEFATWDGCELYNIRYTSDDVNKKANLDWLNDIAEGKQLKGNYTECIEFLSDFHSPKELEQPSAWEPDTDYTDWQWWLARSEGGDWELVTYGY